MRILALGTAAAHESAWPWITVPLFAAYTTSDVLFSGKIPIQLSNLKCMGQRTICFGFLDRLFGFDPVGGLRYVSWGKDWEHPKQIEVCRTQRSPYYKHQTILVD